MGATAGRYACVLAASVPAGCLHGARRVTCAAGGGARRGSALFAQRTNLEDLFSSSSFKAEEEGEDFVSKSQSRKRSGELRKLGQDIVALPPKTRLKLKLPARLMEVVDEWQRVGKKGGGSGPTKGKARLEALMAQVMRELPEEQLRGLETSVTAVQAGIPHSAGRSSAELDASAEALHLLGRLTSGDQASASAAMSEVFELVDACQQASVGPKPDRQQLRQLIERATVEVHVAEEVKQREVEAAAAAAAAAAASAATGQLVPSMAALRPAAWGPPTRARGKAEKRLAAALAELLVQPSASGSDRAPGRGGGGLDEDW